MSGIRYHYCCDCSAQRIRADGFIRPNDHAVPAVAWFTDLEDPSVTGLGLTRHLLTCDRTAHRFEVDAEHVLPWGRLRSAVPPLVRDRLELAPGAAPRHWYVSAHRVPLLGLELPAQPRQLKTDYSFTVTRPAEAWDWDLLSEGDGA